MKCDNCCPKKYPKFDRYSEANESLKLMKFIKDTQVHFYEFGPVLLAVMDQLAKSTTTDLNISSKCLVQILKGCPHSTEIAQGNLALKELLGVLSESQTHQIELFVNALVTGNLLKLYGFFNLTHNKFFFRIGVNMTSYHALKHFVHKNKDFMQGEISYCVQSYPKQLEIVNDISLEQNDAIAYCFKVKSLVEDFEPKAVQPRIQKDLSQDEINYQLKDPIFLAHLKSTLKLWLYRAGQKANFDIDLVCENLVVDSEQHLSLNGQSAPDFIYESIKQFKSMMKIGPAVAHTSTLVSVSNRQNHIDTVALMPEYAINHKFNHNIDGDLWPKDQSYGHQECDDVDVNNVNDYLESNENDMKCKDLQNERIVGNTQIHKIKNPKSKNDHRSLKLFESLDEVVIKKHNISKYGSFAAESRQNMNHSLLLSEAKEKLRSRSKTILHQNSSKVHSLVSSQISTYNNHRLQITSNGFNPSLIQARTPYTYTHTQSQEQATSLVSSRLPNMQNTSHQR